MGNLFKRTLTAIIVFALSACTGGMKDNPFTNGIVIPTGIKLNVDLSQTSQFQLGTNPKVELRTISNDFSSTTLISDITSDLAVLPSTNQKYTLILRKTIQSARPLIVMVDAPDIGGKFIDVLFTGDETAEPGLASTLAFELIKYYPNKTLSDYNSAQFKAIKALVKTRIDEMLSQSETLSLSSTPYARLIRYFKNGLGQNPAFMTAVRSYGINYHSAGKTAADPFDTVTPAGLLCSETPEGCDTTIGATLAHYQYLDNLKVTLADGSVINSDPFNHPNVLPEIMPSVTSPFPAENISVAENQHISLTAKVFDLDNDYIDKSMTVEYIPRKLPPSASLLVAEKTSFSNTIDTNGPDDTDYYSSSTIGYDEALDLNVNSACSSDPDPNSRTCDTAYQNIYYLFSDGAVLVAAKWNFRYIDINRPPEFITDTNGHIDDNSFDSLLAQSPGDTLHKSYCDTDLGNLLTRVNSRQDNPWSCVFRTYDPDLDQDPNGAADSFYYSVTLIDPFVELRVGKTTDLLGGFLTQTKINPITAPATTPALAEGEMSTTGCGSHLRCGIGVFQITIDNGVKVAAETKSNLLFDYTIVAYDRPVNGFTSQRLVQRYIDFTPVPARFVSFDQDSVPSGIAPANDSENIVRNPAADIVPSPTPGGMTNVHSRKEIYLSEIISAAKGVNVADGSLATTYGFINETGAARNSSFVIQDLNLANHSLSKIITQPRKVKATALPDPSPAFSITGFTKPYEFDSTCGGTQQAANNVNQTDGWIFEINAVDLDNVGLKPSEPTDPVYLNKRAITNDTAINLNANALQYCQYTQPTTDLTVYQKYASDAAMDQCTWSNTPPNLMQPVPVFYNDGGITKKLVYHRLRVKWQPKDEKALSAYPYPGVLQNTLNNFMLWGLRNDSRDGNNYTDTVNLFAQRKEMLPCATASENHGKINYFNQDFYIGAANGVTLDYTIRDENKRGGYTAPTPSPTPDWRLHGRQQADVVVYSDPTSQRTITDTNFLRWVPFLRNCTQISNLSAYNEPLIWHSLQGEAPAIPHTRINSGINRNDVCLGANFKALSNPNHTEANGLSSQYRSVVLIYNKNNAALTGANTVTLNPPAQTKCFQQDTLDIFPNQSVVAIASSCDYSNAQVSDPTNNPLWDDANTKAVVGININPADFGFSNATPSALVYPFISFNWLPDFYQSVRKDPSTPANLNAINALYFTITPFNTYQYDSGNLYGGGNYYVYSASTGVTGPGLVNDPVKGIYIAIPNSTPGAEYGLLSPSGTNVAPRLAPTPSAGGTPYPYDIGYQVVDWNYSPGFIAIDRGAAPTPTPTPDASTTVFYRQQPGDATKMQIYIKGNGSAVIPVRTSDVSSLVTYEKDPFDVHAYSISNWSGASTSRPTPTLSRTISGQNCGESDLPAGYPGNITNATAYSTLYSVLQSYRKCNVLWTPDTTASRIDDGKKYTFNLDVKDNPNGYGGRYPNGVEAFVPNANGTNSYGNTTAFGFTIEVIETNQDPTFTTTSNGASISNTLAGHATISAYPTPATSDCQQKDINGNNTGPCPETLQSASAVAMEEGTATAFTIFSKSANKTQAFRTLTASRPTYVRVLENAGTIRNYNVPSFSTMSWSATQSAADITNGTLTVSFSWKPTDAEAFNLSTVDGFLIPVDISNQSYDPAPSDASFPDSFKTPAKKSRVWIWAKVKVSNTPPLVQYMNFNGAGSVSLQDNKIILTAGQINTMRVQVQKTVDIASRSTPVALTDTFQPALVAVTGNETALDFITLNRTIYNADAGTGFDGCAPSASPTPAALPTPGVSSGIYREDYPITFCPSNSEAGKQYLVNLRVTDPGDVSLGLAKNPDPGYTCNSKVAPNYTCRSMSDTSIASKVSNVQFLVQIVGPPQFVSPKASTTGYAYINQDFSFPLSLKITRPAEMRQDFFIGIDSATATTGTLPYKSSTTVGASTFSGFYVSEKYALKWWGVHADGRGGVQSSANFLPGGATKNIPMYAVMKTYCQASTYTLNTGAGDKELIRYNESSGQIEKCKVKGADIANNSAASTMAVALNYSTFLPSIPTLISARTIRPYTVLNTASPQNEINQQFADFKARCRNCDISPSTNNTSVDGLTLTSSSPLSVTYGGGGSNNGFINTFTFSGTEISKEYADTTPPASISAGSLPAQYINFVPAEGEKLLFKAELNALPSGSTYPQYHWYVNGCLRAAGFISNTSTCTIDGNSVPCITQEFDLSTLMSGRNDDCSGAYTISESAPDGLGKLVVRLTLGRGNEVYNTSPAYDGTTSGYVWVGKILNHDPFINTDPNPTPSPNMAAPVKLTGADYIGDSTSTFALPVTFNSKEFIAYTDESKTAAVKVRLKQIDDHGDINTSLAPTALSLDCQVSTTTTNKLVSSSSNLKFLGINPETSGGDPKLTIAVSKDDTWDNSLLTKNSSVCFTNTLSMSNKNVFEANESALSPSLVGTNLAYSKFTTSALTTATHYSNDVSANYLLFRQYGINKFWDTTPITSSEVLPQNTAQFTSYSQNKVRKVITSGTKVFYLVGSTETSPASISSRGFILAHNLALSGTRLVLGTPPHSQNVITFTAGGASDPSVNSQDCNFNGSPVDGAYIPANDTLIATVNSYDSPYGKLVAIKNISTSPTCRVLNDKLLNPSLDSNTHNQNLIKMVFDQQRTMLYGITTARVGVAGQFFVIDPLSEKVVIRDLPSTLYPHEVIFSQNANALYIYDNRRSTTGTVLFPTLYRIW